MGETEIIDELRVIISEEDRTTAYFTFSSQMRPSIHQLRVFGPKNGFILDQDQEILIRLRGDRFKSYLEKFVPPILFAGQYLGNFRKNIQLFLARDFHMSAGMKCLIESFYHSIRNGTPVPIPYREILLTARIMDTIFDQLSARQSNNYLGFRNQDQSWVNCSQPQWVQGITAPFGFSIEHLFLAEATPLRSRKPQDAWMMDGHTLLIQCIDGTASVSFHQRCADFEAIANIDWRGRWCNRFQLWRYKWKRSWHCFGEYRSVFFCSRRKRSAIARITFHSYAGNAWRTNWEWCCDK